jgi:hypothetical protein
MLPPKNIGVSMAPIKWTNLVSDGKEREKVRRPEIGEDKNSPRF